MNGLMERFWENSSGAQSRNSASNKLSHKLTFSTGFGFKTLCELGGFLQVSHNLHHYPNPHHHHYHHLRKVKIPTAVWRAGFDSAWRFPGGDINVLHDIEIFLKIYLAWYPNISKAHMSKATNVFYSMDHQMCYRFSRCSVKSPQRAQMTHFAQALFFSSVSLSSENLWTKKAQEDILR